MLNLPVEKGPHCLTRDFTPNVINKHADPAIIAELLVQPDYTSYARTTEKERSLVIYNIHAAGHFGVGGRTGIMGDAWYSPSGKMLASYTPLSPGEQQWTD